MRRRQCGGGLARTLARLDGDLHNTLDVRAGRDQLCGYRVNSGLACQHHATVGLVNGGGGCFDLSRYRVIDTPAKRQTGQQASEQQQQ